MSDEEPGYAVRVTRSAERQLNELPEGTAAAIVEILLGVLFDHPHCVDERLQRELAGMWSARRGSCRVVCEIDEPERLVIVLRIEHRSTAYRPR